VDGGGDGLGTVWGVAVDDAGYRCGRSCRGADVRPLTCVNAVHPVWGKESWPPVVYRAPVDAQLQLLDAGDLQPLRSTSGPLERRRPRSEQQPQPQAGAAPADPPAVEVVRSARRRRTISAERVGDRIVVHVPARMSRAEEAEWVTRMVRRILAGERRRHRSDDDLLARAVRLSATYLDGRAQPAAVRWVDNQQQRWGSCTPSDRTIRLSRRLASMPDYVVDYVLLHELAHLIEPGHGPAFAALMAPFPTLERAEGYLEGAAHAASAAHAGPAPHPAPAAGSPAA
jgi:predicted metal-dependent hydrolase